MVRILHYIPEEYAPGSTPRQIILTLILPERAAKVRFFLLTTKPFSKKKMRIYLLFVWVVVFDGSYLARLIVVLNAVGSLLWDNAPTIFVVCFLVVAVVILLFSARLWFCGWLCY